MKVGIKLGLFGLVLSFIMAVYLNDTWYLVWSLFSIYLGNSVSAEEEEEDIKRLREEEIGVKINPSNKYFEMNQTQTEKFNEWRRNKNKENGGIYLGQVGGSYSFSFTPTGIGTIIIVKCSDGTELDLTEEFS